MRHIVYTDYPFTELGDMEGEPAPLRTVEILSYDGNKYCTVRVVAGNNTDLNKKLDVKYGYLYDDTCDYGFVTVTTKKLAEWFRNK